MVELNGVANADTLGGGIYDFVALVVVEGRANAESVTCAEVPDLEWSRFVVYGYFGSNGYEGCDLVVDDTVLVFPR